MNSNQVRVQQFMAKAKQPIAFIPQLPDEATRRLAARLVLSEALETVEALGFNLTAIGYDIDPQDFNLRVNPFRGSEQEQLRAIADGLADVEYVSNWTWSACGMANQPFYDAVCDNNDLKVIDPKFDENGKVKKPEGHLPPDLLRVVEEQVKHSLSVCSDLLITAAEGGSNYWADFEELADGAYRIVEQEQSGDAVVLAEVTPLMMAKACQKAIELYQHNHKIIADVDLHDAETADIVLQVATFGELVYG